MSYFHMVWESVYDFCLTWGAASAGILAVFFQDGVGGLSGPWWIPFFLWFACGVLLITLFAKYVRHLLIWWRERPVRNRILPLTERVLREGRGQDEDNFTG